MWLRIICSLVIVSFTFLNGPAGSSVVHAGKPSGGGGGSTPPDPALIWEYRPELGGWLDKQKNLVWGYSLTAVSGSMWTFDGALKSAPNYPTYLASIAVDWDNKSASADTKSLTEQELGDEAFLAGDLEDAEYHWDRASRYAVLADEYSDSADLAVVAANYASQYTNWRIPTSTEAVDAVNKSLFKADATGLVRWDESPYVGFQAAAYSDYWTSTAAGANGKNAYLFNPIAGDLWSVGKGSAMPGIVVRTHTP